LGLGLGLPEDNPPTGLLTKTQPNPRVGFSWAGLGDGRVLARPRYELPAHHVIIISPSPTQRPGFCNHNIKSTKIDKNKRREDLQIQDLVLLFYIKRIPDILVVVADLYHGFPL
jgi:hypothetical protein